MLDHLYDPTLAETRWGRSGRLNLLGIAAVVAPWAFKENFENLTRLQAYVNDISQRLAKQSHRSNLTWTFTVLDSPEVNAFALPGGFVYVTRGIMAGIYLAEYDPHGWLASVTRFVNDILLSAPSIVIGLFVYAVVVSRFKTFSGWAGVIALALIVIPVVIRTTENMLQLVPPGLREAAYALGAPKWKVILSITMKAARAGVITGILLAVARIAGETAPLLFTALSNQFWTSNLGEPMASLPVTIFKFAMSPYENWQKLAWAGVFLITFAVLGLNILARVLTRHKN